MKQERIARTQSRVRDTCRCWSVLPPGELSINLPPEGRLSLLPTSNKFQHKWVTKEKRPNTQPGRSRDLRIDEEIIQRPKTVKSEPNRKTPMDAILIDKPSENLTKSQQQTEDQLFHTHGKKLSALNRSKTSRSFKL